MFRYTYYSCYCNRRGDHLRNGPATNEAMEQRLVANHVPCRRIRKSVTWFESE